MHETIMILLMIIHILNYVLTSAGLCKSIPSFKKSFSLFDLTLMLKLF